MFHTGAPQCKTEDDEDEYEYGSIADEFLCARDSDSGLR